MGSNSRLYASEWKKDIYNRRYDKVVNEIFSFAMIFHKENDKEWIGVFEALIAELDSLSKRMIMEHVRKYMKDFLAVAIKAVKGECGRTKLRNQKKKTLDLLAKANSS